VAVRALGRPGGLTGYERAVELALADPRAARASLTPKAVATFHHVVFGGMTRNITGTAQRRQMADPGRRPTGLAASPDVTSE
jgi:hypothetical protein